MPLPSLPDECFSDILSLLDNGSLYKCLFVNRYYCKLSIPIIWRDPFFKLPKFFFTYSADRPSSARSVSLINTLLSCLNEDEISSLIPCAIYLIKFNNQPLFEYGNFIRKINHRYCICHVEDWLRLSNKRLSLLSYVHGDQECRVQKLVDAIYHMIMRKGSNLQKFVLYGCIDLPKFSTFTIYKPGIINLSSLVIICDSNIRVKNNAIEFLRMVPEFCNCIINCEIQIKYLKSMIIFTEPILNIIKLQPLKRLSLCNYVEIKKILCTLKEFRSETLKELLFQSIDFRRDDLSFISKLKFLERLEFLNCTEFTFKEKLYLKELKLCYYYRINDDKDLKLHAVSMINSFCSEILHKLSLNIVTPETIKAVKETCPNISFLCIEFPLENFFNVSLTIPLICELSSLKTLNIKLDGINEFNEYSLIRLLCNHLMSVEYLYLNFHIGLQNFEYFINNCKVKLKRLYISILADDSHRKSYLVHANNFQKFHNSLKIFGIKELNRRKLNWTDEEIEIFNSLKHQGTDTIFIW